MKILRHIIILSALITAGCTDDIDVTAGYDYDTIDGEYFIISPPSQPQSRVTYEDNTTMFEDGDRVGMFALNADNSLMAGTVENACYYVSSITNVDPEKPSRQVLKPVIETEAVPKGAARYMVYYPYRENITLEQAKQLNHSVRHNQSDIADYEASDLIWDIAIPDAAKNCVNIAFDHAMANFIVKIERELLDSDKGIYLLGSALTAKGINLTAGSLDEMLYTTNDDAAATGIAMCPFGYANNGELLFRVAIPAHQTVFTKDSDILKIFRNDGSEKIYRLATDIELKPGFNYTLTIRKGSNILIIPEAGDDDSWVLEVTDPTDGELVGYLCREYIYWAPAEHATNYRSAPINDGNHMFEKKGNLGADFSSSEGYMLVTCPATDDFKKQLNDGRPAPKEFADMVQGINSQAWIFYNLKPHSSVPDLTKGTILRILYDIKAAGGIGGYTPYLIPRYALLDQGRNVTGAVWPKPHTSNTGFQGIFKAVHGHDRINTIALYGGETGYAYDSEEYLELYMHGGTITWDPNNNIIDKFFMPVDKITNEIADRNGHIAITEENGVKTASVSYSPLTSLTEDEDGNSVGQLIIKNIVINGHKYPLRKVGFNQFWSGKSVRNLTDADGKKLECFNSDGEVGAVNYAHWSQNDDDNFKYKAQEVLPAGYIYPTGKKGKSVNGNQMEFIYDDDYDPWHEEELRSGTALLYNRTAFISGKLKPHDTSTESYRHPTWNDMIALRRYGGYMFAAKWITDKMRTKQPDETYIEGTAEALKKGLLLGNRAYCANISGLDFRAYGLKWPTYENNGEVDDLGLTTFFYIDGSKENPFETEYNGDPKKWVELFKFSAPDCWGSNNMTYYRHTAHKSFHDANLLECTNSRIFAPVRVIMSFNNPIGNGAQEAEAAQSRASIMMQQPAPRESRNIFVPLTE